jgi:predicted nucleic acid-binding protein
VRRFVDTNVLVYADSADEPAKQVQAIRLIRTLLEQGEGVVSTQVLQEFVNVALRKLALPPALIHERLALYRRFEVVVTSPDLITAALDLNTLRSVSFYDALIVQAAQCSGCVELLSEDLQTGATIAGVHIVNPFDESIVAKPQVPARPRQGMPKKRARR